LQNHSLKNICARNKIIEKFLVEIFLLQNHFLNYAFTRKNVSENFFIETFCGCKITSTKRALKIQNFEKNILVEIFFLIEKSFPKNRCARKKI